MTNPHPHKQALLAIANDVSELEEIEIRHIEWGPHCWESAANVDYDLAGDWVTNPGKWIIRRKQRTIKVNGFDVPAPRKTAPEPDATYFWPDLLSDCFSSGYGWLNDGIDKQALVRGLVHDTEEAAIAHAKAMLGIDPY